MIHGLSVMSVSSASLEPIAAATRPVISRPRNIQPKTLARKPWASACATAGGCCRVLHRARTVPSPRDATAGDQARRRAHAARRRRTTCSSAARASPGSRSPASSPAPAPGRWSSTATRSASARPRPARRRPSGSRRWASPARSARPSTRWSSTRPHTTVDFRLPWTFSTFDYRELCGLLWEQCDARVRDREGRGPRTPSRATTSHRPTAATSTAPLVVDALGWKRVLAGNELPAARRAALARARGPSARLERAARDLDRPRLRPGRLRLELPGRATRSGSASARSTRASTSRSRPCGSPRTSTREAVRYQGNWIPHKLRPATADGDLLRRRLGRPLPAADRRGDPHRLLLRDRLRARAARGGRGPAATARRRCAATREFSAAHEWKFEWMLRTQQAVPRVPPRLLAAALRGMERKSFVRLVVRPLPGDRRPRSRRAPAAQPARAAGPLADDQVRPGEQQGHPANPFDRDRLLLEPEDPEPVDHDRERRAGP